MIRHFFCMLIFSISCFTQAAIDTFEFSNEADHLRYKQFIDELRCPTCQNQNLSGSDSIAATDLRKQLYKMIEAGRSDEEIVQYMLDRYGDFILYKPRITSTTIMLWSAPFLFLLIGVIVLIILLNVRKKMKTAHGLSKEEQAQLDALLKASSDETRGRV